MWGSGERGGGNEGRRDRVSPGSACDSGDVQTMINEINQQFIGAVKDGRGDHLKVDENPELFSGLFWTGERALELGLIDGLKSPGQVARDVAGLEEMVDYTVTRPPVDRFLKRLGTSTGTAAGPRPCLEGAAPQPPSPRRTKRTKDLVNGLSGF